MSHLEKEKSVLILDAFLNDKNNEVKTIANKLGVTEHSVHKVINKYLNGLNVNHEEVEK